MIEIKDIQTAVAKLLKKNDYSVVASEVKEGFTKPACFIEVMPVSVTIENQFNELITNSVEISYRNQRGAYQNSGRFQENILVFSVEGQRQIFVYQ